VPELVAFLHSGVVGMMGTAGPDLAPALTRTFAPRVAPDRRTIDTFVGRAQSTVCLGNLGPERPLTLTLGNVADYRGVQIKGVCTGWADLVETDALWLEDHWRLFRANCVKVGLTTVVTDRLRCRDLVRITLVPMFLFRQTPGPGAGGAVEGGTRWA
jgi:hypothetical protein